MTTAFRPGVFAADLLRAIRTSESAAVTFVLAYMKQRRMAVSEWSAIKLIADAADTRDAASIKLFLGGCDVLSISAKISKRAYKLIAGFAPPSPLSPDDAIIAATAIIHKLPLYALDPARFAIVPGLAALQPY